MKTFRWTERRIEREQVANVFSLGGGELSEKPWGRFRHWFDGPPSWAGRTEYPDMYDGEVEYRTVLICEMYGEHDTPNGWRRLNTYRSSGEADCWWCGDGTDYVSEHKGEHDPKCKLCEGSGYVYLGDGWGEVVYKRVRLSNL